MNETLDIDDTILVGERNVVAVPHRVASRRLVLVGCALPTNTSEETEVDLQSDDVGRRSAMSAPQVAEPGSTVPASSSSIRNAQHPAVVVPSGGIQLHNSFGALNRNDEDDVTIDGNAFFFR